MASSSSPQDTGQAASVGVLESTSPLSQDFANISHDYQASLSGSNLQYTLQSALSNLNSQRIDTNVPHSASTLQMSYHQGSTTTTEHLPQDQMTQIHVPMASTSTGRNSPPSSYFIKHVGMDDGLENSLLPRLNSPYVAQHQTNNAERWPSSLKIPTWVHVPSGAKDLSSLRSRDTSCDFTAEWEENDGCNLFRSRPTNSRFNSLNRLFFDREENEERSLLSAGMRTPTSRKRNDFIAGDDRLQIEMISQTGNGIRVWYESYCSIDWLHELIKESIRRKKLAQLGGLRGVLNRCWDRSQAWVLVTLIGVFTGLLASMITSAEIYLYDFKDGYCSRSWFTAKRFCCRSEDESTSQLNSESLVLTLASIFNQSNLIPLLESPSKNILMTANNQHLLRSPAFSKRSFLSRQWSSGDLPIIIPSVMNNSSIPASLQLYEIRPQSCPDWRRWSDLWSSSPSTTQWTSKLVFIFISLALAGLSSVLTVYFSRSTTVISNSIEPKITKSQTGLNEGLMSESSRSPDLDDIPSQASLSLQTKKVSYFASGSGIPEIKCILSGFVIVGYLGAGTLIVKSVALALVVSSGLSLGKEGPFVHIGSCMGNLFVRMFPKFNRNEGKKREILSSACAAGIAAAFGAPIGGVLFSMEEVSYFFPLKVMWRSCWCTMVAVATLKALDPFRTGKTVLFEVTYDRSWHFVELNAFILLGIIGGVLGAFFAKANNWWSKNVRKISIISNHPIFEVLVISLVTSLLAFTDRFMKLGGTELVYEMLAECNLPDKAIFFTEGACTSDPQVTGKLLYRMGITATLKYLITVITFGTKVPAGVFIPSLVIGGLIGRMMGLTAEYFHYVYPDLSIFSQCDPSRPFGEACIVPGVWAMVGATAMLAGVTRTAVALVVIIAELTGSLTYILPIAVGVLVAKTTADVIERRSIYDFAIENLELPFLDAKTDYLHYVQPCDVMDSEVEVIDLGRDIRVSDLRKLLGSSKFSRRGIGGFPIIEKLGEIRRAVGYIGITELEHALIVIDREGGDPICSFSGSDPDYEIMEFEDQIDLGHLVDRAPVTVSVNSATELIHEMFVRLGVRYLIIQYENGSYAGIIEKKRWLRYLDWIKECGYKKL